MAVTIDNNFQIDTTVKIFENFYNVDLSVPFSEFDMVNGFFNSVCSSQQIAQNYTFLFFYIAQNTGIPVLTLLQQFQQTTNSNQQTLINVNSLLCYYLNSFKSKVSLYGITVIPQPNPVVARNVVQ